MGNINTCVSYQSHSQIEMENINTSSTETLTETTSFPTKFKVSDKKAEKVFNFERRTSERKSIFSELKPYRHNHCTEVLAETQFSTQVTATRDNGFVDTVIKCYNRHHNLVIRPDDIWTAILTQFSFYINKNAGKFRKQFVNFDEKKDLVVTIIGTLRSAPYDHFVAQMTEKIHENLVDEAVKDWILPNFSTTTVNDILSCGVTFMATMKKYFNYSLGLLGCGIPYVTLEGTVADWQDILNRLDKLKEYNLDKWYDLLKPVLKEFVAAKQGKVNRDFWNRMCHHLGGSSISYISGWVTVFAAFNEDGNWTDRGYQSSHFLGGQTDKSWLTIDMDEIPSGVVDVNLKIVETDDEGMEHYESLMIAGHVGFEVLEDGCTLKPQIGWGIALKSSDDEQRDNSSSTPISTLNNFLPF